jgi:hypothetical protein
MDHTGLSCTKEQAGKNYYFQKQREQIAKFTENTCLSARIILRFWFFINQDILLPFTRFFISAMNATNPTTWSSFAF